MFFFEIKTYDLYVKFTKDARVAKQQKMKRDTLKLKSELAKTSSQVNSRNFLFYTSI